MHIFIVPMRSPPDFHLAQNGRLHRRQAEAVATPRSPHAGKLVSPAPSSLRTLSLSLATNTRHFRADLNIRCRDANQDTVVWKITPPVTEWLASASNCLWRHGLLTPSSAVLELGCGVNAITAIVLAPAVSYYVLTDQPYVAKYVEQNLKENELVVTGSSRCRKDEPSNSRTKSHHRGHSQERRGHKSRTGQAKSPATKIAPSRVAGSHPSLGNIAFRPLDWETDAVTPEFTGSPSGPLRSFDLVIACDCVYNEVLIDPLAKTCADICGLRNIEEEQSGGCHGQNERPPTACVVAQQLRNSDVFESWLKAFHKLFRTWRVPDSELPDDLKPGAGYVVHIGFLRGPSDGYRKL
ncbi:uncharacterized protein MKZ38_005704 [Zalerion maritima]|uniref:Uncharacterized protein n=1 Tax=Zalerion maritima TaxID=339359 RepID=A0AAD5RQ98_9PEZI|nr:uncharacterized protein MKZ38_005704 [Zalerion maritima]